MRVALLQMIRMTVVAKTTEVAPMTGKTAQTMVMVGPMIVMSLNNVRRRNQEVLILTQAVQTVLVPTGTHFFALLAMNSVYN